MLGRVLDLASPQPDLTGVNTTIAARTAMNWRMGARLFAEIRARRLETTFETTTLAALRSAHLATVIRNRVLRRAALDALRGLAESGLDPLVLKGGVVLLATPADGDCTRFMEDLDLLLPPAQTARAHRRLEALGFAASREFGGDLHHGPIMREPRSGLQVEIHSRPMHFGRPSFTSALFEESVAVTPQAGLRVRVPGPVHQLLHNMIHAQESHAGFMRGAADFRQLFEFGEKWVAFDGAALWPRLLRDASALGLASHLRSWVWAAHRVFRLPLPDGFALRPVERQQARYICTEDRLPHWRRAAERVAVLHWFVLDGLLRPAELAVFYRYWGSRLLAIALPGHAPWTPIEDGWPRGRRRS
jgi:hypothetical protein